MAQKSQKKLLPPAMRINKKILISGSIAYDFIMTYEGLFKDSLLKDHLHTLNVAFTASKIYMDFGGCSPNIAYGIKLLGGNPLIYGAAGKDFIQYSERLAELGIKTSHIGISKENLTASCHILTDKKGNQITIFSPGAMSDDSCDVKLSLKELSNVERAILSPDTCERTLRLANKLIAAGVPYIFDPGQMTPAFTVRDLRFLLGNAEGFIANEYEVKLLCERLGILVNDITEMVDFFIETLGEKGSVLRYNSQEIFIPAVRAKKVIDPTGCGDAFRAGFLIGLSRGYGLEEACKLGAKLGSRAVESKGTQNYRL